MICSSSYHSVVKRKTYSRGFRHRSVDLVKIAFIGIAQNVKKLMSLRKLIVFISEDIYENILGNAFNIFNVTVIA